MLEEFVGRTSGNLTMAIVCAFAFAALAFVMYLIGDDHVEEGGLVFGASTVLCIISTILAIFFIAIALVTGTIRIGGAFCETDRKISRDIESKYHNEIKVMHDVGAFLWEDTGRGLSEYRTPTRRGNN